MRVRELTSRGRGAIRVIELVGAGALDQLRRIAPRCRLAPGDFGPLALRDRAGALLDEALALVESEARVELHLHGAPALVARVLEALGGTEESEASVASPPQSPQAQSIEERAEARLPSAPCEAAARVLLDQVQGALRRDLESLLEGSAEGAILAARELARRGRIARWLIHPAIIVLAGRTNAGKSTLFNVLVGRERTVVAAEEGTTRDAVRERVQLGEYVADLFDTAGERALPSDTALAAGRAVEREGQALAAELQGGADLVLWLVPSNSPDPLPIGPRLHVLRSQDDRRAVGEACPPGASISARYDPGRARTVVLEVVHSALGWPARPWVPGTGVPFEPEWVEALGEEDVGTLKRSVGAWLAGRSRD